MQQVPLLQTKLYVPPLRPGLVSRPRLIERLNAGLPTRDAFSRALTLISAPAGFGKTTLVSEWVQPMGDQTPPIAVAWLSLDKGDNDPARFLAYLIAALQTVETNIGKGALSALQSPQAPPARSILIPLINEIAAISGSMILVLDDYHAIESSPVDGSLAFLLERLPPQMHLVIATREDPRLPLARLRARGQLTEIRAADLRFTSSESAEFLNRAMGLDLSLEDIAALEARAEGWIAGLQLAAVSLQGSNDASSLIRSFTGSHRHVLDYLIEEVLDRQSASVQTFLLQTAILDRLTGPLCDAVRFGSAEPPSSSSGTALTGQEDGQQTLEMLERANLFIVPLDSQRHWYRFHHLFADLLRQRLRLTHPEELAMLHRRAGDWFRQQGYHREAIKYSLVAGDYQGAAESMGALGIDIIQQGEHTTVSQWIHALPEELVQDKPYLCVLHAWALLLAGQLDTAQVRLMEAERALESPKNQDDEQAEPILALVHSHRAYLAFMMGEHDKTISFAHQALDRLPESAALMKAQTALYLGVAYRFRGQFQPALNILRETLPRTRKLGSSSVTMLCYLNLADVYADLAQLHRAKAVCEQALAFTEQLTGRPEMPFTGYVYVTIGRILRQWNQLEDSYNTTAKGLALCRDWNVAEILALSCIEFAYIHQALGNDREARASMQEAMQVYESFSPWGSKYGAAHQAKMDLARGDIDAAGRWAQANDLVIDGDFESHREIEYLALARVYIAQERFEEAQSLVERIYRIAQETGKRHTELEGLILLALVFSIQGETDRALAYLEKALFIGEPEGFVRIFVDEGPPMAHLLYNALSHGVAPEYVSRLLAAFPVAEPEQADTAKTQSRETELVEPLSERELEILQLIAEGLTNPEIAARLFLAVNTVKAHTRNIYGKLGVHSRTQAIARSRVLGILPRG
jgi:LuxR family maltose regulon positive regulatory protein